MGRFDDQVVVVTGAGGGLGRAHALLLAAEGAQVVVNDYGGDHHGTAGTSAMADAVVEQIRSAGGEAVADSHDVALDGAAVVDTAIEAFGRVDAVVNNAGIAGGGMFDAIEPEAYDRMLAIHLGGTLAVSRAAWPLMREQGYGRIVNTSSASVYGMPGSSHYLTAKAALFGLTRALGHDGKRDGIKVNAVMPSAYSRLTAQSKEFAGLMEAGFPPDAVSPFVAALASRDVPVTGETFVVGGGHAARVILGTVPGLVGFSTVDEVLDRFDEAMNSDEIVVPANAMALVVEECARLGIDPGEFLPQLA